jgi:hypothetical protein
MTSALSSIVKAMELLLLPMVMPMATRSASSPASSDMLAVWWGVLRIGGRE